MASNTPDLFAPAPDRLKQRPIFGGVFGMGRFALASMPCVSHGLHATRYMVVESQAGAVLSMAEDKVEALAGARRILTAVADDAANEPAPEQLEIWPVVAPPEPASQPVRQVSRRRREVFDRSEGHCHYCGTVLTLDGNWHVEHMKPRALGGGDNPLNLVAACVRCNLEKSDLTALEYVARKA